MEVMEVMKVAMIVIIQMMKESLLFQDTAIASTSTRETLPSIGMYIQYICVCVYVYSYIYIIYVWVCVCVYVSNDIILL